MGAVSHGSLGPTQKFGHRPNKVGKLLSPDRVLQSNGGGQLQTNDNADGLFFGYFASFGC